MSDSPRDRESIPATALGLGATLEEGSEHIGEALHAAGPMAKLPKRQILLIFIAQLTIYLAFVAPTAYSLALRVQAIDPATKNTVLALAIGIPGVIALFTNPLVGVLSDRTRTRLGRRRTWMIVGAILGLAGSVIIGLVPNAAVLIAGWTVAFIGYSIGTLMILTHFGDRLPESQRGKVMGINGAITQIGPIIGIVLAGSLSSAPALMFLIPGAIAFIGTLVFIVAMKDPRAETTPGPIRVGSILQGFWFNPRALPNLGWVWLSKALIFLGISFMSIYTVYLLSSRLGIDAGAIAGVVSTVGILSVGIAILGAILSGWLSDRLGTRKPFLVASGVLLAAGLVTIATTSTLPQYIVGAVIGAFSIGVYGAVDQAVQLDVLPQDEGQNGRFIGILGLANQAPQAFGPFLAAVVLAIGAGDYTIVYVAAAVAAVLGALAILPLSVGRRAALSTTSVELPR